MKLCPKCQKQFSDDANFCPVDAARLLPLEGQAAAADDAISSRFELGARLGGGRTGEVRRAADKTTGQLAVVKIIAPAVVALPGVGPKLERELKQLERVHSAGVAKVLASGKRGDDAWVALELVDGAQSLAGAISERGPIAFEQAAHLVEVVGEALIEAAQVGVVHRDLAPKNVLFAGDEIKLINFSLPVPSDNRDFVAPEQLDGKPVDQRSNLYSLGALYYYVLTGKPPQHDDSGALTPPSTLANVPPAVEAIILRALDRSPTKRYLTVRQFVDEVARVARGKADAAAPQGRAKPKAELVQTLLGVRAFQAPVAAGASAAAASGAAGPANASVTGAITASVLASAVGEPATSAQTTVPERSPWAPPVTIEAVEAHAPPPAAGDAVASHLGAAPITAPSSVADVAATVEPAPPAAPVVPAPLLTAPILPSKDRAAAPADGDNKGKFRETLWFKKGELDAAAAAAAEEERARTGREGGDKADQLPPEERYKDDGTVSRSDKEKYSLRTGDTTSLRAMRETGSSASVSKVSEDALISEMKGGRGKTIALLIVVAIAVAVLVVLFAR